MANRIGFGTVIESIISRPRYFSFLDSSTQNIVMVEVGKTCEVRGVLCATPVNDRLKALISVDMAR